MPETVDRFEELTPHDQHNVVAALEELYQTAIDAKTLYQEAVRDVRDDDLRSLFTTLGKQRETFAGQIAAMLSRYGERTSIVPSTRGELHRIWTHFRAAMDRNDPAGMISECERGEHHAEKEWQRMVQMRMPGDVQAMLLDQLLEIRGAREALEKMRHPW